MGGGEKSWEKFGNRRRVERRRNERGGGGEWRKGEWRRKKRVKDE